MKPSQIRSVLSSLIDSKTPICLWGPSGIGKSSIIKQLALSKELEVLRFRLSLLETSDLNSLISLLPKEGKGVLLFKEVDSASDRMQAFVSELAIERQVGSYKLPESWNVIIQADIALHDKKSDEGSGSLTNYLIDLDMQTDISDWKDWAYSEGMDERVIAYIAFKNEALLQVQPNINEKTLISPKSWERVSEVLKSGIDENLMVDVLSGVIGKENATSFLSFAKGVDKLPDIESILQKSQADYPSQTDVLYTLSSVLVSFLLKYNNEENLENVLKYSIELEPEFSVMIVQELQRGGISMETLPSFPLWVQKFASIRAQYCQS